MNKRGVRAFALGMLVAVSIIGTYYFYFTGQSQAKLDEAAAKQMLAKKGYVVLPASEYQKIKKANASTKPGAKIAEKDKTLTRPKNNPKKNQLIAYSLKVTSGMSPEEISNLLVKHHIIENGDEFEQFLTTHHFATKIQVGTYHLTDKMDYQEITKLLTK